MTLHAVYGFFNASHTASLHGRPVAATPEAGQHLGMSILQAVFFVGSMCLGAAFGQSHYGTWGAVIGCLASGIAAQVAIDVVAAMRNEPLP